MNLYVFCFCLPVPCLETIHCLCLETDPLLDCRSGNVVMLAMAGLLFAFLVFCFLLVFSFTILIQTIKK